MSIICLEGASGVGKTTTCAMLERDFGFNRIPEVNELFNRPLDESPNWYFEKQIERWQLASKIASEGNAAVMDGDPFQPLWYNWIFGDIGFQSISDVIEFYLKTVKEQRIKFPEKYFVLVAPEDMLRARKESDNSRSRRNFEMHLQLINPQLEYFKLMNNIQPGLVQVIESDTPENTAQRIVSGVSQLVTEIDQMEIFELQSSFVLGEHNQALQRTSR